jgi:hypothetical protein
VTSSRALRPVFGIVLALAMAFAPSVVGAAPGDRVASGATNLGFCGGDDWEPEIAASGQHVYVGIAHFPVIPPATRHRAGRARSTCGPRTTAGPASDPS